VSDLRELTVRQLAEAIRCGETTAEAATTAYLDAIDRLDGELNCYNEVFPEAAIARARAVDAGDVQGPLAGVPIALKDNLATTFGRTTCSSKYLADYRSPYTATAVQKLLDAGAVILGKTNLDEFAMGSSCENSALGPTRNPWDNARVPGGSSGGSAAAVAGRLAAAAIGSDTGGSIRQPASFCGIVGCKPTYGRVSRFGLVAFGSSLDQIGPMTRDVADTALLTAILAGQDPRDATSIDAAVPDYLAAVDNAPGPLRIGIPGEFLTGMRDEIAAVFDAACDNLAAAGVQLVDVSLPHSRIDIDEAGNLSSFAVACYYVVATAEASSNLARYDGVHYGHRTAEKVDDIVELYCKSRRESLGPEVKRRIMLGTYALSSGYYDAYYNKALKVRRRIAEDFTTAFASCDLILTPTTPTAAFELGAKTADPLEMYLADIYTVSLNLAGLPGISVPAGFTPAGLPVGVQLIGPVLSEPTLFAAARQLETACDLGPLVPPAIVG
jgi:aspartyl-tRNA(Asn)/glutamyl-tRNA(Gln) amidotransferase subunit A